MTTLSEGIPLAAFPQRQPEQVRERWRSYAFRRMSSVFERASVVPFDTSSRIVFFSDIHRGDGSQADGFVHNAKLFLQALRHYHDKDFTYIEVGDGDELWKGWRFEEIRQAYPRIFDLLHDFAEHDRLHLIVGNHDVPNGQRTGVEKDGLMTQEGLVLRHATTGQQIFVLHGHQADFKSDYLHRVSRFTVGHIWVRLQRLGLAAMTSQMNRIWKLKRMERAIIGWLQRYNQIVICGHTHRPMSAVYGEPPYFNTGSCMFPGCITGLELQNGEINLVSWFARPVGTARIERHPVAPPRKLSTIDLWDRRQ
jgi:UDP-2,3-diacylglucosamine pyrophosphatase LpxH